MKFLIIFLALVITANTATARVYIKTKKGIKIYKPEPIQSPAPIPVPKPKPKETK